MSCPSLKQCSVLPDREGKFRPGVQTRSAVASAQGGQVLLSTALAGMALVLNYPEI